jgi:PAS domain S-box-containing protein
VLSALFPLFAGPAVLLPIAAYAVLHRRVRGALWYAALLTAVSLWSLMYAWELTAGALEFKILALKIKYVPIAALPGIWLAFVLDFVGTEATRIRRVAFRTALVSGLLLCIAWTNEWHGWFWGPITSTRSGEFETLIGRGPGFVVNIVFTYGVLWTGIGILATRAFQAPYIYGRRCGVLIAATVLPWMGNLIFLTQAETVSHIDPTPFLFTCTGLLAALAVFRYGMLDALPALSDARPENLGDGVLILDALGRVADLNDAAQVLLGRRREQVAGLLVDHVLPGLTRNLLEHGSGELLLPGPAGPRVFEARATPIQAEGAQPRGSMVLLQEVTERRAAAAAIRSSEQRYRHLVENANDLIVTCDLDGRLLSVNRAAVQVSGYSRRELVGRRIAELVAPEVRPQVEALFAQMRQVPQGGRTEVEVLAKDGRRIPLEISSWIQAGDGGAPTIQAIARDLTGREQYEAQLRQSQKMEAVGKLAAGIAHDFNNLLTAILGFTDLAERPLPPDSPSRAPLAQIRRSGQQAAALTRQLLAFARRQILQPVVLDLNETIADLGTMLPRLLGEDVEVVHRLAPDLDRVRVDVAQIQQVIINLAVNARDAMPRGGALTITTRNATLDGTSPPTLPAGRYVALSVADTGLGISPEILQHIFEPFFTTKAMGQGTGLGLATVHGIVKQSGGDIVVDTQPGRGTAFIVYLPATTEPLSRDEEPLSTDASRNAAGTVLLVEDDEAVREFASETLRSAGWRVIEAAGPLDALARLPKMTERIDVVVTDVVMPGLSGGELADRLDEMRPGLPVLFISGYADQDVIERGQLRPRRELLSKPFTGTELVRRIRSLLDEGRTIRSPHDVENATPGAWKPAGG